MPMGGRRVEKFGRLVAVEKVHGRQSPNDIAAKTLVVKLSK